MIVVKRVQRILSWGVLLVAWSIGCWMLGGCSAAKPGQEPGDGPQVAPPAGRVFVCCEGNFMYGNAALSLYDPQGRKSYTQLFYDVNGFPLGDVFQSMTIVGRQGYLVMNNSGKVVVMDVDTYLYKGVIKGLVSPRYVMPVGDSKLYISDLYSPEIAIADPHTLAVTGYVKVGRTTESLVLRGDDLYTCSWAFGGQVFRIDTRTDQVVDSLTVTAQPNSMALDCNGKLWVLSDGGYPGSPQGNVAPAITVIDAATFKIDRVIRFADANASPSELTMNPARDTVYFIHGGYGNNAPANGLYRMYVSATELPDKAFIPENGRLFYGLGIDPVGGEIYLSDAIDYTQSGIVLRYMPDGRLIDQFKVDIIPGAFCFKP